MSNSFGPYIRNLREAEQMPLRKLAAHLDIDQSTLSKIERNERKLSIEAIPKLAEVFKLDYKQLKIKFLSEQVLNYLGDEEFSIEVLKVAEQAIKYKRSK